MKQTIQKVLSEFYLVYYMEYLNIMIRSQKLQKVFLWVFCLANYLENLLYLSESWVHALSKALTICPISFLFCVSGMLDRQL